MEFSIRNVFPAIFMLLSAGLVIYAFQHHFVEVGVDVKLLDQDVNLKLEVFPTGLNFTVGEESSTYMQFENMSLQGIVDTTIKNENITQALKKLLKNIKTSLEDEVEKLVEEVVTEEVVEKEAEKIIEGSGTEVEHKIETCKNLPEDQKDEIRKLLKEYPDWKKEGLTSEQRKSIIKDFKEDKETQESITKNLEKVKKDSKREIKAEFETFDTDKYMDELIEKNRIEVDAEVVKMFDDYKWMLNIPKYSLIGFAALFGLLVLVHIYGAFKDPMTGCLKAINILLIFLCFIIFVALAVGLFIVPSFNDTINDAIGFNSRKEMMKKNAFKYLDDGIRNLSEDYPLDDMLEKVKKILNEDVFDKSDFKVIACYGAIVWVFVAIGILLMFYMISACMMRKNVQPNQEEAFNYMQSV